ncbi:hypothetical protein N7475_004908 [Penicillium sp. IBT 31633x]|nr:hypothetical protein N7475_004908 [Penicillium sp. IBT 31633x]
MSDKAVPFSSDQSNARQSTTDVPSLEQGRAPPSLSPLSSGEANASQCIINPFGPVTAIANSFGHGAGQTPAPINPFAAATHQAPAIAHPFGHAAGQNAAATNPRADGADGSGPQAADKNPFRQLHELQEVRRASELANGPGAEEGRRPHLSEFDLAVLEANLDVIIGDPSVFEVPREWVWYSR